MGEIIRYVISTLSFAITWWLLLWGVISLVEFITKKHKKE